VACGVRTFSDAFRSDFAALLHWRRDVRAFRTDPVDEALLSECLDAFLTAPSVGLSEPWRVVRVTSGSARAAALANFRAANAEALEGYEEERATTYARLKLSGMERAPVHLVVCCDDSTAKGSGLGARTMPEMRRYSVVAAITQFWLAARAHGLGVGWVSILDPERLLRDLALPDAWRLVGYLCVGWPEAEDDTPELARAGWDAPRGHLPLWER